MHKKGYNLVLEHIRYQNTFKLILLFAYDIISLNNLSKNKLKAIEFH